MKPIIFLASANDQEGNQFLRKLSVEMSGIRKALREAERADLCELVERANVTIDDILDVFQDSEYRDRVAIFHYCGHADGYQLLLESASGRNQVAHGEGLVSFFKKQKNLHLIFFNGCTTKQQTKELSEQGIPLVVGTHNKIKDDIATDLSVRFYKGLGQQLTVGEAWEEALDSIKMKTGSGADRGMLWEGALEKDTSNFPWELMSADEASKKWNFSAFAKEAEPDLPPEPEDPKMKILHFMSFGMIEKAIDAFLAFAKSEGDSSLEMDMILQSGRYHGAKKRYNSGATSEEQWKRTEAQLLNSLKSIYSDLD